MENLNDIGLDENKAKQLAEKLNELLANYSIFYQNTRGYHWNIKGEKFFELHLKFEELYNDLLIKIDDWPGWMSMMKTALPFTTIAWVGILLLIFMSSTFQTEWLVLSNLFVGIAILTLPHLQVFTKIRLS